MGEARLKMILAEHGDPRRTESYALAEKMLDVYNASGLNNRDRLVSALALILAQMFASVGADEAFARQYLKFHEKMVLENIPVLRKAMERQQAAIDVPAKP